MGNFRVSWPGVAALGLVLAAVVAVALFAEGDVSVRLLEILAVAAALVPSAIKRRTPTSRPPKPPRPPVLWILSAFVVAGASGCGASALQTHAQVAQTVGVTLEATREVYLAHHLQSLERVRDETEGQPREEREAAIIAEHERLLPAASAIDAVRDALRGWVSALELAHLAGEGESVLPRLLVFAAQVIDSWDPMALTLQRLGIDAPRLPTPLRQLVSQSAGGE